MTQGQWKEVIVPHNGTTSAEVDLGADFKDVLVLAPDLDNASIAILIAKGSGGTFFTQYILDDDATGDFGPVTTASTTAKAIMFYCGVQFIKIFLGASQGTTKRTFYVRGIN